MCDRMQIVARNARNAFEMLFSLHLAFLLASLIFIADTSVLALFSRMEYRMNKLLHIEQTDFVRGYFAIWIASLIAAILIWALLRLCRRSHATGDLLSPLAGILTILGPPVFWAFIYEQTFWPVSWPYEWAPFELAAAVGCTVVLLSGRLRVPTWAPIVGLAAHFLYWYLIPGSRSDRPNYMGPSGPLLGFLAGAAWIIYIRSRSYSADPDELGQVS